MRLENFFIAHFQQSQERNSPCGQNFSKSRCHKPKKKKNVPHQNHYLGTDGFFPWNPMVKALGWNSNRKTVKQTAKQNGTCERLTHQWCQLAIMQGQAYDLKCSWSARITSYATVVNRLRPVEFKTIPQPRILHACHQWRNTDCVFVTRDFRPSVWPCSWSNFGLGLSPSNSSKKVYKIRDYGLECSFS